MKSSARLAGHPLHPIFVHFPVALWSITWAWDVLGAWTGSGLWWQIGFWCLVAGTVIAVPAAVTGVMELMALGATHPAMDIATRHMLIMGGAFTVNVAALVVRAGPLMPEGWRLYAVLALSSAGLVLLAIGGWYGGRLVYEFGVGRSK
jgi:uncharacterized membrane protein